MEHSTKYYYEVLELPDNSPFADVKASFRRLSIKNKAKPQILSNLESAYEVLSKLFTDDIATTF